MAKSVHEIMNRELFSLRMDDDAADALGYILALGITAAPILDDQQHPVGVVSFRDLLPHRAGAKVSERMTSPAITVTEHTSIEQAATLVAERGVHRVVVVDEHGAAVGVASTIDLIAGLLGLPAKHPDTFPHYDRSRGITWTDDTLLDMDRVSAAPDGPGVLVLVAGGKNKPERPVWCEASTNVRTRLFDLLSRPQDENAELARVMELYHGGIRFRASAIASADARSRVAESVMSEVRALPAPAGAD